MSWFVFVVTNACSSGPCASNGVCTAIGSGYTCSCSSCYSGNNCQTCNWNQLNRSLCKNYSSNRFVCQDNPCCNNQCANGATCQVVGSSFQCLCPSMYSGTYCQTCKLSFVQASNKYFSNSNFCRHKSLCRQSLPEQWHMQHRGYKQLYLHMSIRLFGIHLSIM